jgi:hypothetical protein
MNPVDLIRELAEALQNLGGNVIEHTPHELALLTRAQAFLAAQPVVVEPVGRAEIVNPYTNLDVRTFKLQGYSPGMLCVQAMGEFNALQIGTSCTVHVVVTPGVR